jgi:DNA-binding PucR family transcriptional regulator
MDLDRPDPRLLVPDADGPGRLETVRHALRGMPAAIGPSVALSEAPVSLRLAGRALALAGRGVLNGDELIDCDRHLATLALLADEDVIRLLAAQRLGPLTALRPSLRGRLTETLRCWLESRTGAPEIAARLKIHPQTVRYRMHQVEDLFGDRLHDPDWRIEMELALRADLLLSAEHSPDPAPGMPV